jgi:hypothetical protein
MKDKANAKNYGMKLQNQSYSHYFLLRYIGAAIAFEVVKDHRSKMKPNLDEYKCPESIGGLYKLFYSLSFEARTAIESMLAYSSRN